MPAHQPLLIVLDTNVLVSALLKRASKPGQILDLRWLARSGWLSTHTFCRNTRMYVHAPNLTLIHLPQKQYYPTCELQA